MRRLKESSFGESLESTTSDLGNKVLLVEKCDWESEKPTEYVQYVTLSHCWGKLPEAQQTKLCSANIEEFKRGIKLEDLPKTFSQAMQFAARLPEVGYIWIDSLCIKQGDKEDWLAQSAHMGRIYKEAFLNLSATAATDSQQGLFTGHVPRITIGDEATLNIFGLPGATKASENFLRECAIFDLSIWANRIENAPVNKRGWVLQERLMAPRVLHFCLDRVAWECCEFEAAEGQPEGMLNYQLTLNGIRAGSRLKGLDPLTDGVWLRHMRLRGYHDPDPHLQPGIYTFELWRRIVEVYCKTVLTLPGDKLIALSGLARWMSERIEKTPAAATVRAAVPSEIAVSHTIPSRTTQYVAGMWALHLASQLLWYVEPTFQHDGGGKFEHLTKAPPTTLYRAPSFSWTAIDTDDGNGITYGEVTDQDILIIVEEVSVTPRPQSDAFGMLEDAYIVLQVKLRKAVLLKNGSDRFKWKLVGRGSLDQYEHTDVYLDCPARDENEQEKRRIIGPDAGVFVVLGAWTDRKMARASKYLTCLILQLEKREAGLVFHRIGLTKLSPYGDRKTLDEDEILKKHNDDADILDGLDYDPLTGMHRIRLV
ncbi:heterokaryon incompatibility protein-domain-containing protein [Alternaria rosae]|uniref:heterokaryon incompatibility protein-domain-containing protein n=1 Tax=Alternaria rosae TaxID=1187941 RepID=UPI001E8D2CEA|nr:heterokaryon incompatibility protein-domain-containing protein [Alternaria rosae]KAH6875259.1 heterokaryon incompatibility protein-domain-containing protein [Alternaria rosae]